MEIITIPRVLREKLGDNGADSLVELLNRVSNHTRDDVLTFVEEKFEHHLSKEIGKVNERITEEISKLDNRLTEEMGKVNERITKEISKLDNRLTEEIGKINERIAEERVSINQRITEEVAKVNQRVTDEIAMVRGEIQVLRTDMHAMRADLIKWMFIFWAGQIGVILGILFAFFR